MKLHAWMAKNAVDDAEMASRTGTDRTTISRVRRGLNRPSWDLALKIVEKTDRKVTLEDLAALDPSHTHTAAAQ